MTYKIQAPLRDCQQEMPVCDCEKCGGEVYRGESLFEWQGKWVCRDCFQSELGSWLWRNPEQVAQEFGFSSRAAVKEEGDIVCPC